MKQNLQQSEIADHGGDAGHTVAKQLSEKFVLEEVPHVDPDKTLKTKVVVVIPLHNEAENIKAVCLELLNTLKNAHCAPTLLLVDDGSTDGSLAIIEALAAEIPEIQYLSFSRNFGKEAALMAGLHECGDDFDLLSYMDSDGQHNPDDLVRMIATARASDCDIVCGARVDRNYQTSSQRWMAKKFYQVFAAVTEQELEEGVGDFNVLRPKVVRVLRELGEEHLFIKGLMSWIGFKREIVPIAVRERAGGEAKSSTSKMMRLAFGAILSFSSWPLRAWSVVGIFISLIALMYLTFVVFQTVAFGRDVPGYASTIVLLLGFGGLQLISVGILGEYIARIYDTLKRRPRYVISTRSDD